MERGDELWLTPFVTSNWLKDDNRISVKDAPTTFGKVSFEIVSHADRAFIEARVELLAREPGRKPPSRIVLRFRHPQG